MLPIYAFIKTTMKLNSATKRVVITGLYFFAALLISACSDVREGASGLAEVKSSAHIEAHSKETRSHWRKRLAWNDDCEESFSASYAGLESGIEVYTLKNGLELVSVLCSAGAYQPSFLYFIVDEDIELEQDIPLKFLYYESADGQTLQSYSRSELWGEPLIDTARGQLSILNLARQTGDCGSWAVYAIHRENAELLELWARFPCPVKIEAHAEQQIGKPPEGWVKIDHD